MTARIVVDASQSLMLEADLRRSGAEVPVRVFAVVRHFGQMVQSSVMANASGRPGPRAITGDYRRSIALATNARGQAAEAIVGTNKAQGRRLEFGFEGADSLGRVYHQAPLPHFGPAIDRHESDFVAAVQEEANPW